jgi:hypothetical protein
MVLSFETEIFYVVGLLSKIDALKLNFF